MLEKIKNHISHHSQHHNIESALHYFLSFTMWKVWKNQKKCTTTQKKRWHPEKVMGTLVLRAANTLHPSSILREFWVRFNTSDRAEMCSTYRWTLSWGRSWSRLGLAGRSAARKSWRTSALLASCWGRQLWTQTQWVSHWNPPCSYWTLTFKNIST